MPNSLAVWRVLLQDVLGTQIRNGLTENLPYRDVATWHPYKNPEAPK